MLKRFAQMILVVLFSVLLVGLVHAKDLNVECSTGSANCTLVSGSANQRISVRWFLMTVNADDTVVIKCGSTNKIGPHFYAQRGGLALQTEAITYGRTLVCGQGEDLTLTKGAAATPLTFTASYDHY